MTIATILAVKGATVATVTPDLSVTDALQVFQKQRIGAVVVTDGAGAPVGVLSERDVVRALATTGPDVLSARVLTIMSAPVITVEPRHSIQDAMALMTTRRIRHLPVIDGGQMIGIVSIGDLVKLRIEQAEREADALKSYIAAG